MVGEVLPFRHSGELWENGGVLNQEGADVSGAKAFHLAVEIATTAVVTRSFLRGRIVTAFTGTYERLSCDHAWHVGHHRTLTRPNGESRQDHTHRDNEQENRSYN